MRSFRTLSAAAGLLTLLTLAPGRANGQGAVAFSPTVGAVPDGVGLSVTPAVSADRRYVRLSLDFQSQTVGGFSNFPIPGAVGGGGGMGGGLRSVGVGPADFAAWYPELGVPRDTFSSVRSLPLKPLNTSVGRSKKPLPDPEIVPIKKKK